MPLDPDLVRCDLLKIKRKLYNSYPENSDARKNFLMASKLGEIGYLSKIVPPDVVNVVFDEYKFKVKQNLIDFIISLSLAISSGLLLNGCHQLYPKDLLFSLWYIFPCIFLLNGIRHLWNIGYAWYGMKDFRKEYKLIKEQIKKLSDEVKRIGDGK